MKKPALQFAFLLVSTIGMGAAQAFEEYSATFSCWTGGSTYMCSESSTTANVLDAIVFTGGQVKVHAYFRGPDYYVEKDLSSEIFWLFPFTWNVTARLTPWRCAYSGAHSAEAFHSAHGKRDGLPFPTYGPRHSIDFHVQHYCDCDREMY
jgi:hypothetical protein